MTVANVAIIPSSSLLLSSSLSDAKFKIKSAAKRNWNVHILFYTYVQLYITTNHRIEQLPLLPVPQNCNKTVHKCDVAAAHLGNDVIILGCTITLPLELVPTVMIDDLDKSCAKAEPNFDK
jgi:hypothetical protein